MAKSVLIKFSIVLIVSYIVLHSVSAAPQEVSKQFNYTPDEVRTNEDQNEQTGVKVDERINWDGLVHGLKTIAEGFNTAWTALQERGAFGEEESNNNEIQSSSNNDQKTE